MYTSNIFGCFRLLNMAYIQEARCPPEKLDSPTASEKSSLVLSTINFSKVARTAFYTCSVTNLVLLLDTSPFNNLQWRKQS